MKAVVSGLQQYVWLNEKTIDYTPVDLNALVEEIAAQLQQDVNPVPISLQHNLLPTIEGDQAQLAMLLRQLLSNAVKFRNGESARVQIEGTVIKQNRFRSVENKYAFADFVRLEIFDKGIGFDPMYADHIFELFRKLHQSEGLGLGLALCKKIVENHQGHIEAESELNKFTKVTVWLPCFQNAYDRNELKLSGVD
ncbi:sensor histidine kinase [Flavisolibacter nicotianae]|uniref:sensor histidine kinase n=1 Tax=Flavisolibacter nicotianae TaxID=2364882 RepID=UPI001F098216|nr:HAMP domain-containing sensor histidine kinase [Flavisolibacter nicotianae]